MEVLRRLRGMRPLQPLMHSRFVILMRISMRLLTGRLQAHALQRLRSRYESSFRNRSSRITDSDIRFGGSRVALLRLPQG